METFWRRKLGSDPDIIGRHVAIQGMERRGSFEVIGVLSETHRLHFLPVYDVLIPVSRSVVSATSWAVPAYIVIGRRVPGVTTAKVEARLGPISIDLARRFAPASASRFTGARVEELYDAELGNARPRVAILTSALLAAFLVGCLNVALLQFAGASNRLPEFAIRAACGADRWRLAKPLSGEYVTFAISGGALAVPVGAWALLFLRASLPAYIPRIEGIALDGVTLGAALGLTLLSGLVFGALPVWVLSDITLANGLSASNVRGRATAWRSGLLAVQLVCVPVLVLAATLLVWNMWKRSSIDLGFDPNGVLVARGTYGFGRSHDDTARAILNQELLRRTAGLNGVIASALTVDPPPARSDSMSEVGFGAWERVLVRSERVSPGYFNVLAVPVLQGRDFTATDRSAAGTSRPVIVNAAFATKYLGGLTSSVGFRFRTGSGGEDHVIGVVGDVRAWPITSPPQPAIYHKFGTAHGSFALLVRARPPGVSSEELREAIRALDPGLPLADVVLLSQSVNRAHALSRAYTVVFVGTAGLAIVLAICGMFALGYQAVSERTAEIRVRLALGATPLRAAIASVRKPLILATLALTVGTFAGIAACRGIGSLLYEVSETDAGVLLFVAVVLLMSAIGAFALPLRRAMVVDPVQCLRNQP